MLSQSAVREMPLSRTKSKVPSKRANRQSFELPKQKKDIVPSLPASRTLFGLEFCWTNPTFEILPLLLCPSTPEFLTILQSFSAVSIVVPREKLLLEGYGLDDRHLELIAQRLDASQLAPLRKVTLHGNHLSKLPAFVGRCTCKLRQITFDKSLLDTLPSSFRHLVVQERSSNALTSSSLNASDQSSDLTPDALLQSPSQSSSDLTSITESTTFDEPKTPNPPVHTNNVNEKPSPALQFNPTTSVISVNETTPPLSRSPANETASTPFYSTVDTFSLALLISHARISADFPLVDLSHLGLSDDSIASLFNLLSLPEHRTIEECTTLLLTGNSTQYFPAFLDRFDPHTLTKLTVSPAAFTAAPFPRHFGAPPTASSDKSVGASAIRALILFAREINRSWPHLNFSGSELKPKHINMLSRFRCAWTELLSLDLSRNPISHIPLFFAYLQGLSCNLHLEIEPTENVQSPLPPSSSTPLLPSSSTPLPPSSSSASRLTPSIARYSSIAYLPSMYADYQPYPPNSDQTVPPSSLDHPVLLRAIDTPLVTLSDDVLRKVLAALLANSSTISRLDLRSAGLTDATAALLPLKELTATLSSMDCTANKLTQIPTCFAWLDPGVFTSLQMDSSPMQGLDREFLAALSFNPKLSFSYDFLKPMSDLIGYAKSLLEGAREPIRELRLMVVGPPAVGKTSLIRNFRKECHVFTTVSTDGIDLGSLEISKPGERPIMLHTWDFGGQPVYQYTHQLFYQSHAVYLMLCDLSLPLAQSVAGLHFWLSSISSRLTGDADADRNTWRILLVATKCDRIKKKDIPSKIQTLWQHAHSQFPALPLDDQVFPVAMPTGEGTKELLAYIFGVSRSLLQPAPLVIRRCLTFLRTMEQRTCRGPFLEWPEFTRILQTIFDSNSIKVKRRENLVRIIPTILERLGSILLLRGQIAAPTPLAVVLRPQWLAQLFASIVTTKHLFVRHGILHHRSLPLIWSDPVLFPSNWHDSMILLLQQCEVLFPLNPSNALNTSSSSSNPTSTPSSSLSTAPDSPDHSLVPCLLTEQPPNYRLHWPLCYREDGLRQFWITSSPTLPPGFLPRLLCRFACYADNVRCCWSEGIVAQFGGAVAFLQSTSAMPKFVIDNPTHGCPCLVLRFRSVQPESRQLNDFDRAKLLRLLTAMIENLCTEYYRLRLRIVVPCGQFDCYYTLDDSVLAMHDGASHVACRSPSPSHVTHKSAITAVAPDVIFADLDSADTKFILSWSQITKEEGKILGSGSFGQVIAARYKQADLSTMPVAVKILNRNLEDFRANTAMFSEFSREAFTMASLSHPNIVRIYGVCLNPPGLVMQLAGGGTLFGLLNDPLGFEEELFKAIDEFLNSINRFHCDLSAHQAHPDRTPAPQPLPSFEASMQAPLFIALVEKIGKIGLFVASINALWSNLHSNLQQYLQAPDPQIYHAVLQQRREIRSLYRSAVPQIAPISWSVKLKIAYDVASAMRHAHNLSPAVLHRDLKSPNIFLTAENVTQHDLRTPLALVGDYGLSGQLFGAFRAVKGAQDAIDSLLPLWAAPEVLDGREYSSKSDVFSFAVILWELVTRESPWEKYFALSDTTSCFDGFETLVRPLVVAGQRLPIPPDTLEAVSRMISACWAQDPVLRPTFNQVVAQLEALIKTEPSFPSSGEGVECEELSGSCSLTDEQSATPSPPLEPAPSPSPQFRTYPIQYPLLTTRTVLHTCACLPKPCALHDRPSPSQPFECSSMLVIDDAICWMGLSDGSLYVQALQQEHMAVSNAEDAHLKKIISMCYCPVSGGLVWCVSKNEMSVWQACPRNTIEYIAEATMSSLLSCKEGKFWIPRPRDLWVVLAECELRFYQDRHQGFAVKSIFIHEIASLQYARDSLTLRLRDNSVMTLKESSSSSEQSNLRAWYSLLNRLHVLTVKQLAYPDVGSNCLGWLAYIHPSVRFTSVQPSHGDQAVWTTSKDNVIREWRLSDPSRFTGVRLALLDLCQTRSISLPLDSFARVNHLAFDSTNAWAASPAALSCVSLSEPSSQVWKIDIERIRFMTLLPFHRRFQIGQIESEDQTFHHQVLNDILLDQLPAGSPFLITISHSGNIAFWNPSSPVAPVLSYQLTFHPCSVTIHHLPGSLQLWTSADKNILLYSNPTHLWVFSLLSLQLAQSICFT